nr:crotonase [Gammaproteobacteria bacterium]
CALQGLHVTLQDRAPENIAPAIKRAAKLFKKKLRKPYLAQAAMDRLQPDLKGHGCQQANIIIEAIFEDVKVKQDLFKELQAKAKPDAILATNTSTIPLEEIATVLKDPSRLVGIHFFNPVAKMLLVEVVKGGKTDPEIANKAQAFVGQIGKLPLPVASSPGFLINRLLMPYLLEALEIAASGVPLAAIDKAAEEFGMPMGPVTLADMVGLDVLLSAAKTIGSHFKVEVPSRLAELVALGRLGKKTGKGFYEYDDKGKRINKTDDKATAATPDSDIAERMILRMVNEAVVCLDAGVINDADLLDGGMIFGTGFAPFRGGPLHYAGTVGYNEIQNRLEEFAKRYGERFTPAPAWNNFIKQQMSQSVKPKATAS